MMWSKHSRRIDPISRSAKLFCQGEAGAIGLSRIPMARSRRVTTVAVDSISISDHIARSAIPRKSLGDLTCNPLRRRVGCDADPDEISAIKPDNDEAIQQLKANGRHYEQIHRGDVRRVVLQKGPPFLTWRPASLDHILGDT